MNNEQENMQNESVVSSCESGTPTNTEQLGSRSCLQLAEYFLPSRPNLSRPWETNWVLFLFSTSTANDA